MVSFLVLSRCQACGNEISKLIEFNNLTYMGIVELPLHNRDLKCSCGVTDKVAIRFVADGMGEYTPGEGGVIIHNWKHFDDVGTFAHNCDVSTNAS